MTKIHRLPSDFIGRDDRERLESFGGHSIARGRATRWHWAEDDVGNDRFEIFRGGADERLTACIRRDREADAFRAWVEDGHVLVSGPLDHVLAELDAHLAGLHGEDPERSR